jgi:hypothetical protein
MTAPMRIPTESNNGGQATALAATLDRAMTVLESSIGTEAPLVARLRALCERLG